MSWKKRSFTLFFVLCIIFTIFPADMIKAAGKEMNIYCIYLGAKNKNKGDSVLVESKGQFLLMDLGSASSYSTIKKFLKERGVKTLSLYISHTHDDHTGGLKKGEGYYNLLKDFNVEHVYLPDKNIGSNIDLSWRHERFIRWYEKFYPNANINHAITYLKAGSKFSFGDVNVEVIGPVGMEEKVVSDFLGDGDGTKSMAKTIYLNNCSLVSMLTCGKTKFFTGGDIDTYEERKLADKYGSKLKADIYKMSHHGSPNANTEYILKYIQPTYTFAPNSGSSNRMTGKSKTDHRMAYSALLRCSKYGFVYLVGAEKVSSAFKTTNNSTKIYRTNNLSKPLSGYFAVEGGDGQYVTKDHYYFGANGKPLTGIQTVKVKGKKQKHYFGTGGREEYGEYVKGKYNPWKRYDSKKQLYRYFDKKTHEMMTGVVKQSSKSWYYCDPKTGYRTYGFIKLKGKTYYCGNTGTMYKDKWLTDEKNNRFYFDKNGIMAANGYFTINGVKYYFNKDGSRASGLTKIGNKYYYFNDKGSEKKTSCTIMVDGVSLTFDKNGVLKNVPASKKPALKSAKASGKNVHVEWEKVSEASGYEVYMSTERDKGYKMAEDVKSSKYSAEIKGLARGTYFVKVASYRKIGGIKFYSKKSSAKTVVIK